MTQDEQIQILEDRINKLEKSDRYVFEKKIQFLDGRNIILGNKTGNMIGTDALQKIGFFGITPVTQRTGVAVTAAGIHASLVSLGLITI